MIKSFIIGAIIGIAGFLAAIYFVPVVDQDREISLIAVSPNGGNAETFHINMPGDRIVAGENDSDLPAGIRWPESPVLDGTSLALYKVRNSKDAVIGVASRLTLQGATTGGVAEWALHLPARGSMYVTLDPVQSDGLRVGEVRAGTREFDSIVGTVSERWVENAEGMDELSNGRIELVATTISSAAAAEPLASEGLE